MLPRKRIIAAGVATLLVGIVATFPARVAYNWFAPPGLSLSGVNGSIWNGAAAEGLAGGLYFRNLDWRFHPLALLTGKIAFSTHSEPAAGYLDCRVAVSPGGAITLSDVTGNLSLQAFERFFQLQGFEGQLNLQFDTLVIDGGIPVTAIGTANVANLTARQLSPTPIGNYRAEFATNDAGVSGKVADQSGVLEVAGDITIGRDRSYAFIGQVAARPQAPAGLRNQLQYLGSPDANGRRDFRIEGQL